MAESRQPLPDFAGQFVRRALLVALAAIVALGTPEEVDAQTVEEAFTLVPPELAESVEAPFPEQAFADDVEADVVLEIDIEVDGSVSAATPLSLVYYTYDADGAAIEDQRVVEDDPYGFVAPAIAAVLQYRFEPAREMREEAPEGVAIPVRVTWRVGFVVDTQVVPAGTESVLPESGASVESEHLPTDGEASAETPSSVGSETRGPRGAATIDVVTLRGTLLQRGFRVPLAALVVVATRLDDSEVVETAVSDESGSFAFTGLDAGTWRLAVETTGYNPFSTVEVIVAGQRTEVVYYIEEDSRGLLVSETVVDAPEPSVTRRTIAMEEIQRIPGNNNDAIRVVQNLPGVARPAFGGGDVIVRGSEPTDSRFFLDGMEIPAVYHFGGLRSVFPTELLSEISFYPGGFGAEFGRATGGIIDVRTRNDAPERITGHVDVNLFDTGLYLRAPLSDRVFIEVGGRRSYIDAVLKPLGPALGLNFATAPRYYDYQLRLVAELGDNHTFSVLGFGSDDRLAIVAEDEEAIEPEDRGGLEASLRFHGLQARLVSDFSDTVTNELSAQYIRNNFGASFGSVFFFELQTNNLTFRDTIAWTPSDQVRLRYGMDIQMSPGNINLALPRPSKEGEVALDFEASEVLEGNEQFNVYQPAHFIDAQLRPIEQLTILPSIRSEYYRPPERWAFDARLGLRFALSDSVLLKGSIGSFHQAPTPDETSESFGNPDLELENAIHYVLGTELQLSEYISLNIETFYKDLNNSVSRSDEIVDRGGTDVPEIYANDGVGRVYGAELLLRHDFNGRFFGWIAYTLSRSERRDPGTPSWRLFDFDQTHIFTALGTYRLPRNWSVGARWRLVSGNPVTPIVGSVFDSDSNTYVRVPGAPNSERASLFHQLDIRVDKRWIFDRWTFNAYLDLQNIYNRMNQEDVTYNYDYTEESGVTGLPLIPGIGLRAEF